MDADCPLTRIQRLVLSQARHGGPNRLIGERLGLSYGAVRYHLHEARQRLGVATTHEALAACAAAGWLDDEAPDDDASLPAALVLYLEAFGRSRYPHRPTDTQDRVMGAALQAHRDSIRR